MDLDGKRQRNALTAAERSIQALGRGDGERAIRSASKAADLDQLGVFAGLVDAVEMAAAELGDSGSVSAASWQAVADAVGPGPLGALIDGLRG